MFERYTEQARRVLFFSRYGASQTGSRTIEPEHLLLGLIREPQGTAGVLARLPLDQVRGDLEARITFRERLATSVEIPFSAPMKRVLEYARQEADQLGDGHIGSEHLLLGLLRQETSVAATVLIEHGLNIRDVREQVSYQPADARAGQATPAGADPAEYFMGMALALEHFEKRWVPSDHEEEARALVARIRRDLEALVKLVT